MTETGNQIGLVLEGGAMRGMFTGGILDVFMENRIEFDAAVGVSAGAVFGCNLQSRQIGRTIRYNMKYAKNWRYSGYLSLLLTGDLYGGDFDYRKIPEELDPFDIHTFEENPMKFYCVVTDAVTGKAVYHLCETGTGEHMHYMQASASMPAVSRPVLAEGRQYLDGGIADSIPLPFLQKEGYEKNVVILTQPADYRKKPANMTLMKPLLRKYPAIIDAVAKRHDVYNEQVAFVRSEEAKGNTLVIAPEAPLEIGHLCKDPKELERVYQLGRKTGEAYLEKVKAFVGTDHIGSWNHPYPTEILPGPVSVR